MKRQIFVLGLTILCLCALNLAHSSAIDGIWYVSANGDDTNDCLTPLTACAAISAPMDKPGFQAGDTILIEHALYGDATTNDTVVIINQDVVLSGGWDETFTEYTHNSLIRGSRAISISAGVSVTMTHINVHGITDWALRNEGHLTFTQGRFSSGSDSGLVNLGILHLTGGEFVSSPDEGIANLGTATVIDTVIRYSTVGIYNRGDLTLIHSTIANQVAAYACAGIWHDEGTLLVIDSAIVNNEAQYVGPGGGLCNFAQATIVNSTISGNLVEPPGDLRGGGIYNDGDLSLYNVTVSHNRASEGAGIYNTPSGTVRLYNSLIANNTDYLGQNPTDCYGNFESYGHNLISTTVDCTLTPNSTDILNTFGLLVAPTHRWGEPGETPPTAPLLPNSPAIDAGNPAGCLDHEGLVLVTDQRYIPRLGNCDIGAYEYDPNFDPLKYFWLPMIGKGE